MLIAVGSVVGVLAVFFILVGVGASRYKKAGPHEAFIATGYGGQKVSIGGGMFIVPVLQKLYVLDLQARKLDVKREGIYSKNKVPITVEATLVYKVRGDESSVRLAAQALQELTGQHINDMVLSVAEGSFRDIVGKMTPEEINDDREAFAKRVTEIAEEHFRKVGVDLISFVVTHISDKEMYFESLGAPAIADVKRTAREQVALQNKSATVVEVEQKKEWETRKAQTEAQVFDAQKERDVLKHQYDAQVAQQRAIADQSYPRAEAKSRQEVVIEQKNLAEREAEKVQAELKAQQIRPAEATREAAIIKAEGDRRAAILEGEGFGESARVRGVGEAEGKKAMLVAEADGKKAYLLAEAEGIKAKLLAEAEGIEKRAKAMKEFNDPTMQLEVAKMYFGVLADVVEAAARPISSVKDIKIVQFAGGSGTGSDGASSPVAKFLDIPPEVIAKTDEILRTTVGYGIREAIEAIGKGKAKGILGRFIDSDEEMDEGSSEPRASR